MSPGGGIGGDDLKVPVWLRGVGRGLGVISRLVMVAIVGGGRSLGVALCGGELWWGEAGVGSLKILPGSRAVAGFFDV